jgi:uncharacterized membrane protein
MQRARSNVGKASIVVTLSRSNWSAIAWAALGLASIAVGIASLRYLVNDPSIAPPPLRASMAANGWIFIAHAVFSAIALIVAPFQLWQAPPAPARRVVHRTLGRVYVACCICGGVSALLIAPDVESGMVATVGFSVLAVVWIVTTTLALRSAVQRDIAAHRIWVWRSVALTLSAVSLRVQMIASEMVLGLDYGQISHVLAWSCWLPQVFLVELNVQLANGKRTGLTVSLTEGETEIDPSANKKGA